MEKMRLKYVASTSCKLIYKVLILQHFVINAEQSSQCVVMPQKQ